MAVAKLFRVTIIVTINTKAYFMLSGIFFQPTFSAEEQLIHVVSLKLG